VPVADIDDSWVKRSVFPYERLPQNLKYEVEVEYVNHSSYANIVRGETVLINLANEHGLR